MHILAGQSLFSSGLLKASTKHLEPYTNSKHIVALGVLWRDKVSYLYHISPGKRAVEGLGNHAPFPAAQSSIGIALLATKSDQEIEHIYSDSDCYEKVLKAVKTTRENGLRNMQNGSNRQKRQLQTVMKFQRRLNL